jgi:hypothetical protein
MSSTKSQGTSCVFCLLLHFLLCENTTFGRDQGTKKGQGERKEGRSHAHDNTLLNEGHSVLRAMHIHGENRKRGK